MNCHAFLRMKFTQKAAASCSGKRAIPISGPATDAARKGTRPLLI
jgi:hypothetical protein